MRVSGKLVIICILAVALAAAGASWWFRYNATHRAAEFWGGEDARQIRDAPTVALWRLNPPPDSTFLDESSGTYTLVHPDDKHDISTARGLIHLRNALLDDRSYHWPPQPPAPGTRWKWSMVFRNNAAQDDTMLIFSADCKSVATFNRPNEVLSCEPIAAGLSEVFTEFETRPAPAR